MSDPTDATRPTGTLGSGALTELALDLRWSFNHAADTIWQRLDPDLWSLTHNPWFVLQTLSHERLDTVCADRDFRRLVEDLLRAKRAVEQSPGWFQQAHPRAALTAVAYFSMEFMLSEALPLYAGGLGNVAGNQLKAASNLGVPVVGVGLLYQQGYFRQELDASGRQRARYSFNDPGHSPFDRSATRMEIGYGSRFRLRTPLCGCARGRSRSAVFGCSCWTRTTQRTRPCIAVSPASSTEAMPNFG